MSLDAFSKGNTKKEKYGKEKSHAPDKEPRHQPAFTHRLRTLLLKLHFRSPNGRGNNDPAHFHSDNGWRRIGTCLFPLPDEPQPTRAETRQGVESVEALGHRGAGRFPLGREAAAGPSHSPGSAHTFKHQFLQAAPVTSERVETSAFLYSPG